MHIHVYISRDLYASAPHRKNDYAMACPHQESLCDGDSPHKASICKGHNYMKNLCLSDPHIKKTSLHIGLPT